MTEEEFNRIHIIYEQQQKEFREAARKQRMQRNRLNGGKSEEDRKREMENPDIYTPPSMINLNLDNSSDVDIE